MDYNIFADYITHLQERENFASWGFISVADIKDNLNRITDRYRESLNRGDYAGMTYMQQNIELRNHPELLLTEDNQTSSAQNSNSTYILMFLASYHSKLRNCREDNPDKLQNHEMKYRIAEYAMSKDYHITIKTKLYNILNDLKNRFPDINGRVFTDSAPVFERSLAVLCGLGEIGKNGFLINPQHGIKTLIGGVIINGIDIDNTNRTQSIAQLSKTGKQQLTTGIQQFTIPNANSIDQTVFSLCGNCNKCLNSCPTGALYEPGRINANLCISYQTIENRKNIFPYSLNNPDNYIFGCDCCLNACPWNSKNIEGMSELTTVLECTSNLLKSPYDYLNQISSSKFNKLFKDSPLSRAGKEKILSTLEVLNKKTL